MIRGSDTPLPLSCNRTCSTKQFDDRAGCLYRQCKPRHGMAVQAEAHAAAAAAETNASSNSEVHSCLLMVPIAAV
jgi:hypothetical protein